MAEITGGQKAPSGLSLMSCSALSDMLHLQYGCMSEAVLRMFCWSGLLLHTKAEPCCHMRRAESCPHNFNCLLQAPMLSVWQSMWS